MPYLRPLAALTGVVAAATFAHPSVAGAISAPERTGLAAVPTLAGPDIPVDATKAHLDQLQKIADDNGGNRAAGSAGYQASVDYVKGKLDEAGFTTTVQEFDSPNGTSYNVIADWPGGTSGKVVMFGSHLDSVEEGPGINDNGSGTAGVLETALTYAKSGEKPTNTVRFAFWGAEEQGLYGSTHYVDSLSSGDTSAIASYTNFDMIASPNPGYFVYDDNSNGNGIRDDLTAHYDEVGVKWEYTDPQGRSDHAAFIDAGIPTGGVYSGGEETKSQAQADKWGGEAGAEFDPCYHQSCDTSQNLDLDALDKNTDTIGAMVWSYATKDLNTITVPKAA
ncbi:M28 family metallopeptidase [Luteipulveratus flavus]|uniref:M28 family metallopeptidase n=1 Tax=Luteipulveratus flavus TaxID=3031728 RepID=A0ABT6C310_9MICO|nr:M28 family metallopeptidase [Luteipulveratus sp. YIM 133296]MDF8263115.1 M28 family metallopeptidase [Luteipulveratus sp. YIM 133296]